MPSTNNDPIYRLRDIFYRVTGESTDSTTFNRRNEVDALLNEQYVMDCVRFDLSNRVVNYPLVSGTDNPLYADILALFTAVMSSGETFLRVTACSYLDDTGVNAYSLNKRAMADIWRMGIKGKPQVPYPKFWCWDDNYSDPVSNLPQPFWIALCPSPIANGRLRLIGATSPAILTPENPTPIANYKPYLVDLIAYEAAITALNSKAAGIAVTNAEAAKALQTQAANIFDREVKWRQSELMRYTADEMPTPEPWRVMR